MEQAKRNTRKQILVISIFVILAAQIKLDLFAGNFQVSLGILVFPAAVYLLEKIPVLPAAALSGIGVWLSRVLMSAGNYNRFADACRECFPEAVFYFVYGLLIYLYYRRIQFRFQRKYGFAALFLIDYTANFVEILLRFRGGALNTKLQLGILGTALARTLLLWIIIIEISKYRLMLLREEHAERYQRLLLLISKLNEEVIWMKKNTTLIEETMQRSYQLYSRIQTEHGGTELAQTALTVAKDIHEIKKEYMLILRGISENLDLNLQDSGMKFSEITMLLKNSTLALAAEKKIALKLDVKCRDDVFTDKHFLLLSVFRNMLTNALEACETDNCSIVFTEKSEEGNYLFTLSDNGPGIPKENLEEIFNPGFSTKINFDTGEVNRGFGLSLVKDVVENQLHGSISIDSEPGNTKFIISIPKEELEVEK